MEGLVFFTSHSLKEKPKKKTGNGMNEAWRDALLLALSHACSQDPSLIKEAEGKLKAWETEPGFYSLLMVRLQFKLG